jgi:signal transduction histidine kinase
MFGPLGYPLEPGHEAAPLCTAPEDRRAAFGNLRLVDCAPEASETDRLHEICHDMRQPVASIMALAEAALSNAEVTLGVRDRLGQIRDQAEWLSELLRDLIEPPATRTAEGKPHDLVHLASEVIDIEMVTYPGDLSLQWSGGNMCVAGNGVELRRAIANLLSNATRAAGPSGKVLVQLHRATEHVLLTVDDSGPGFGLIHRGVGLGLLAVAHGLKSYGGSLGYSRSQLGGVRATLALRTSDTQCEAR